MISNLLHLLGRGLGVMRLNSRLMLVGVLLFVFPLLFVWVTQNFFTTAYDNINTSQKQRVSLLHDSLATVLTSPEAPALVPVLTTTYIAQNPDITKIRVVEEVGGELVVLYASNPDLLGTAEPAPELFLTLPLLGAQNSFIYETVLNGARTWQVFRGVRVEDRNLYIFSEHSFALVDSVMSARRQQSYFGLTAIFLFLIALAYWLNRQVSWERQSASLSQQIEDRDLFTNMIAHEFRSPLTAIKGYASFLGESEHLSVDERRFASNINKSAERLVTLVSDFLEVARLQSGSLQVELVETDIATVLEQVTADLQGMANKKGLGLSCAKPTRKLVVATDAKRLTQILINIVTNAIKYTDTGSVTLECSSVPGEFTIRVKDTGTGISAEDQQKLFAPFTRVGGVDAGTVTGSGLGMWITRQLVTLLHGSIGVESIKGVGTHVVLTFRTTKKL